MARQAMSKRRRAGNDLSHDTRTMSIRARAKGNGELRVRMDVVEAMKRKLAAGEIGNNSIRLADRLIDILLHR